MTKRIGLLMAATSLAFMPGICCVAAEGADPNAGGGGAPAAFDADTILSGTVDKISTGLADLSDEQLADLLDRENKGGERVGVINAIGREQGARADKKAAEDAAMTGLQGAIDTLGKDRVADLVGAGADEQVARLTQERDSLKAASETAASGWDAERTDLQGRAAAGDLATAELVKLETGVTDLNINWQGADADKPITDRVLSVLQIFAEDRAQLEERVAELEGQIGDANGTDGSGAPLYNQVQVDKMLADLRTSMTTERDQAVKEAKTMAETKPRKREKNKALAIGDALSPDDFAEALRDHASQVVLVDDEDVPIAELTPLAFFGSAYNFAGGRAILTEKIEPPRGAPGREVLGAFVLVDGKPIGRAQLVAPFEIGGGRHTELPGGTLSFEPGEPALPHHSV